MMTIWGERVQSAKRCPFCGSEQIGAEVKKTNKPAQRIVCLNCDAKGPWPGERIDDDDQALHVWNSRPGGARMKPELENEIQAEAVEALRRIGFRCWTTSTNKRSGCTPGTPDLLVALRNRGPGICLAIEMKKPGGRVRKTQREALGAGEVIKCDSTEQVMAAVMEASGGRT